MRNDGKTLAPARKSAPRLVLIDANRWRHGKPQRNWQTILFWSLLGLVLCAVLFLGAVAWALHDMGANVEQIKQLLQKMLPETALLLLTPAVFLLQCLGRMRELRVTENELVMRHAWRWLDRWFGWRMPLSHLQHARLQVPRAGDPLLSLILVISPIKTIKGQAMRMSRRLPLAAWAPRTRVDAGLPWGEWPAPAQEGRMSFWQRISVPLWDEAAKADLSARIARLPLPRMLAAQGLDVSTLPIETPMAGQLDLAQVPEFRMGMGLLAGLALACVLAMFVLARWHFFAWPFGLYLLLFPACAVLLTLLIWPKRDNVAKGMQRPLNARAEQAAQKNTLRHGRGAQKTRPGGAHLESCMTAIFLAVMCGGLAAWLMVAALLWTASRTQPMTPQVFVLDKSHIETGPIILRSQTQQVPDIHTDTQVSFWQRQPDGMTLELNVFHLGSWWMYDSEPIDEMRRCADAKAGDGTQPPC